MTPARWTFVIIFGLGLLTGLGIGITELVAPNLATVTLNDQDVTGMTGFWTALLSGSIPGLVVGLIVAGIVALFTRKKQAKT
ncbi:MAG: hypothetical protein HY834_00275 [Devosia nanyangense]|uniref:Uncharacterized protein n=1 Tax=Devosia nanyangense TaxID=1228055 RepID=A0A933KZ36_9HYPH|nr:hypothetical protein [Devosia nanyangense]